MSKKDKVFFFIKGLKLWPRIKLYEKKVQDLAFALVVSKILLDYSSNQRSQKKIALTLNFRARPPSLILQNFRNNKKPQIANIGTPQRSYQSSLIKTKPIFSFLFNGPH